MQGRCALVSIGWAGIVYRGGAGVSSLGGSVIPQGKGHGSWLTPSQFTMPWSKEFDNVACD